MSTIYKIYIRFSLLLLLGALLFGAVAAIAFIVPDLFNSWIPFHQLRPLHTSAALFWIITAASSCICYFLMKQHTAGKRYLQAFIVIWMLVIAAVFINYSVNNYGGREYWEFPPLLNVPLLAGWLLFTVFMVRNFKQPATAYQWMWLTGVLFFLITFTEQNLWQVQWFRQSYLREVTVQWKANGSMVGAWNQMINGLSVFILIQISGNKELAFSKKTFFLFFLGLFNLMFNWGHHVYNVPNANWMRHVAYAVSMTEWIVLISIIRNFRHSLSESRKFSYSIPYRFIAAAELWLFANLFLALLMSVPAINRYTHGTHITVAHAMGTTIGINTMILLAVIGFILKADRLPERTRKLIRNCIRLNNVSLAVFWLSLIVAGLIKGYYSVHEPSLSFAELMKPVMPFLKVFTFSGIGIFAALGIIAFIFLRAPFESDSRTDGNAGTETASSEELQLNEL